MASQNGTVTSDRKVLFTIDKLIPERAIIEVEGSIYEVKAPEEFGAHDTAQIMRYAQGITKFAQLFEAEETSNIPDEVDASVNGLVKMFLPDMKAAMQSKVPFPTKMALSQKFLEHFMSGLTVMNRTTQPSVAPTPLREALGQIVQD